ncbi:MAG: urea transporter, partial [Polyangia bacterium]
MTPGPLPNAPRTTAAQRLARLLAPLFVQVGQIHFQRSARTGLVMLAALAAVSRWAALGAAVASLTALLTARRLRLDGELARAGLLGYNACLIGAGLLSLYPPGARVWLYLVGVSVISTGLSARWLRWGRRLPPLTLLFVLSMWGAAALGRALGGPLPSGGGGCDGGPAALWACGIGQISFVAGALPGLCIAAAITAQSWREGLWLGLGAAAGLLAAQLPGARPMAIGLMVNLALIA